VTIGTRIQVSTKTNLEIPVMSWAAESRGKYSDPEQKAPYFMSNLRVINTGFSICPGLPYHMQLHLGHSIRSGYYSFHKD
jgi:hypothetical protein